MATLFGREGIEDGIGATARTRFALRPWLVRIHRAVGLSLAAFLIVIGLTGSVIAWFAPLDEGLNPDLWTVKPIGQAIPPLEMRARMQAADPDNHYYFIQFPERADKSFAVYTEGAIDPKTGEEKPITFDEAFANQYTGERLGERMWGNFSFERKDLVSQLYFLHYSLVLPEEVGEGFMGYVALVFALDCFVGLALTLPLITRRSRGGRGFWRGWAKSWTIKPAASGYRRVLDIHRALSLWVWALFLMVAVSGFSINLPKVYASGMKRITSYADIYKDVPDLPAPLVDPKIGWDEAYALGQRYMAQTARAEGFQIIHPSALIYQRDTGAYIYRVLSDRDKVIHGFTAVSIDATTGALRDIEIPTGHRAGNTFTTWLKGLHMATIGGTPWKIVMSALGIVLVVSTISGVLVWWRKRGGRRALAGDA